MMCWRATSASTLSSRAAYSGCAAAKLQCCSAVFAMAAYASTKEAVQMTCVPLHCHFSCSGHRCTSATKENVRLTDLTAVPFWVEQCGCLTN